MAYIPPHKRDGRSHSGNNSHQHSGNYQSDHRGGYHNAQHSGYGGGRGGGNFYNSNNHNNFFDRNNNHNNHNPFNSHNQHGFGHHPPAPVEPYTREERNVEDIFKDQTAGIDFSKYEEIQVSITPNTVPACESFDSMKLHTSLAENVRRCGYTKPTPVQKHGIPAVVSGGDLMACAQTGSGKTAAYLIPAVNYMLSANAAGLNGRTATPSALILAPTRELSIQIYDESRKFTFRTGLRCVVVYGGADPRSQLYELGRSCNLLVATPGRLADFYERGAVVFNNIRYLVLDEADRMLDMGFEPQIRRIVSHKDSDMPPTNERQTLMYSATFPREIQQLAREFLKREHFFLQVGRVGSTTENITQEVRQIEDSDKKEELVKILGEHDNELTLVFVEKKREADYLERHLLQRRFSVASIHGDRVQREREQALNLFKAGRCNILVATDVASRGLDIPDVSLVVQYDLPSNIDSYVHRIGRTGRAGKKGLAISFFNEKNKNILEDLITLMAEAKQPVPSWLQDMAPQRGGGYNNNNNYGGSRGRGGGGGRGRGRGYNAGGGGGSYGSGHSGYSGGYGGGRGGSGYGSGGYSGRGGHNHSGGFNGGYSRPGFGNGPAWRPDQHQSGINFRNFDHPHQPRHM